MLSDDIREMRREFQDALLKGGDNIQISASYMQSFIIALNVYEDQAREMEAVLWPVPTRIKTASFKSPNPHQHTKGQLSKFTVIQGGASSNHMS